MPVFGCGGAPACQRLISVSSVPGGNAAALADPEGFATVYLRCKACKVFFCDRCLARLGKGMAEKTCPACRGELFDPNAPTPPPIQLGNVKPKPYSGGVYVEIENEGRFATLIRADGARGEPCITRIAVSGAQLALPAICICCSRPADDRRELSARQNVSRTGNTITYKEMKIALPRCKACAAHASAQWKARRAVDAANAAKSSIGGYFFLGLVLPFFLAAGAGVVVRTLVRAVFEATKRHSSQAGLCLGAGAFLVFAVAGFVGAHFLKKKKIASTAADADKERAELEKLVSPTCCRVDDEAAQLLLNQDGSTAFVLHSKLFAVAFAQANRANLKP